ncbi:Alcohol dehydrogenase [Pedobacter sp. BAL39]|uniref:YhdH/YhfP family quinone oxidoreductase n=1 Tax=Pedobacter sp. BAL39 TaxID=391596 RepID=UPI000155AC77|nr:YhdH/YhfP family quinone oxidoreductase [Pedobacter sp. BAL39]EDM33892.1 Alcohol dehydrogenase [Pedobacter sp. BAL39]
MNDTFQCLLVTELPDEAGLDTAIVTKNIDDLPSGEVLIRVHYSSLNYKDALSATGNKGITRQYPHTPGIDAAGIIERSANAQWKEGQQVIVTGFDLGMNTSGGFAEYIQIPAKWLVSLPENMTLRESMIYGTAGFTAGLSVSALLNGGVKPEDGAIAVSGSTGGVGSLAIGILHRLGYQVAAISSKSESSDFLTNIGATEIIPRAEMENFPERAMLKTRFAGAIDTVGGTVLATLLKTVHYGATVTACGMVNGGNIPATVFPFIIRGIQLAGIDSVEYPLEKRTPIWQKLANEWKPQDLEIFATETGLEDLPQKISDMLQGNAQGRSLVKLQV